MAAGGYVKIYSNDGATLLFTSTNFYSVTDTMTVTETGVTLPNEAYTYSGDKKFLGLSNSANATEATKAVGFIDAIGSFTYYIVEGEEEKTPTLTYDLSQLDLAAGTHSITVRAKADGYADSEQSNAVEYVVEEETYTIPAGAYKFISTLTTYYTSGGYGISQYFAGGFVSNGATYYKIATAPSNFTGESYSALNYQNANASSSTTVQKSTTGWVKTAYRRITVNEDTVVTKEFYEWFYANVTQVTQWYDNDTLNRIHIQVR